jgi:hypothetical protein
MGPSGTRGGGSVFSPACWRHTTALQLVRASVFVSRTSTLMVKTWLVTASRPTKVVSMSGRP